MLEVTDRIERMEALEERLGVTVEALNGQYGDPVGGSYSSEYDPNLFVYFDLVSTSGTIEDMKVIVAAYNGGGQLIGVNEKLLFSEDFFGIQSIAISLPVPTEPVKIRVYVAKD